MAKNFGLLFPGQGTVMKGMGEDIYRKHQEARMVFKRADEILGWPISKLCFDGPEELLIKTVNTHLAVYVTNAAYAAVFRKEHPEEPLFLAGQSLGYFSALHYAKVFSFEKGAEMVQKRGNLIGEQCLQNPGAMFAIQKPRSIFRIKYICKRTGAVISNYNPEQTVISGRVHSVKKAAEEIRKERLAERGIIQLKVEGAFHSYLMTPVKAPLAEFIEPYHFSNPTITIIGNSGAQKIDTGEAAKKEAIDHLDKPVLWQQSIEKMIEDGVEDFEEIGESEVLSKNLKRWLIALGVTGVVTVGTILWYKKRKKDES